MPPKRNAPAGKKPAGRDNRKAALNQRLSRAIRDFKKKDQAYQEATEERREELVAAVRAAVTEKFEAEYRSADQGSRRAAGETTVKDGVKEMGAAKAEEGGEEEEEEERGPWVGPKSARPGLPPKSRSPPPPPPPPAPAENTLEMAKPIWALCFDPRFD